MAQNYEEFVAKVTLNSEEAKRQLDSLSASVDKWRKERDQAMAAGDTKAAAKFAKEINEAEKAMRRYRTESRNVAEVLKNLGGATMSELRKAQRALNKEMQNVPRNTEYYKELQKQLEHVKDEMKGVKDEAKEAGDGKGFSSMLGKFNQLGFAYKFITDIFSDFKSQIQDLVDESIELARSAEGIEAAFQRINKPGMLDELRAATHGTVDDLQLMQQAVKFKDFGLPVEQLGTYLAFAQQKAKDTGESIDYLVDSIVTGLGRQSPQILDNLGLSAKEIAEEAEKSGDFFGAVAKIVNERMAEAGDYMETSAERAARAATALKNKQLEIGRELLPLKEKVSAMFYAFQSGALDAIKWLSKHREAVMRITIAIATLTATVTVCKISIAAWTAVTNILKSALVALQLTIILCTRGTQAFTAALQASKVASATHPYAALATVILTVGVAIWQVVEALKGEEDEARKAGEALDEHIMRQRLTQEVTNEANSIIAEEKTRFEVLRKTLEDSNASYADRKAALDEIKRICPEYHGQLTRENQLVNSNTIALDNYVKNLVRAAQAQAAFNKMVQIQTQVMNHQMLLEVRQANQKYVENQLSKYGLDKGNRFGMSMDKAVGFIYDENGKILQRLSQAEAREIENLRNLQKYNIRRIDEESKIIDSYGKQTSALEDLVKKNNTITATSGAGVAGSSGTTGTGGSGGGRGGRTGSGSRGSAVTGTPGNTEEKEREKKFRKAVEQQRALNDSIEAMDMGMYYRGEINYQEYLKSKHDHAMENYAALLAIYKEYGKDTSAITENIAKEEFSRKEEKARQDTAALQTDYEMRRMLLEGYLYDTESEYYGNEEALQEALFQLEMEYLQKKADAQVKGSQEEADARQEIWQRAEEHRQELEKRYMELRQQYSTEWQRKTSQEQINIALKGIQEMHAKGLIDEQEYQEMLRALRTQYAEMLITTRTTRKEQFDTKVDDMTKIARAKAGDSYDPNGKQGTANPLLATVRDYTGTISQLRALYQNDQMSYAEYQQAKANITSDFLNDMVSKTQVAYDGINNILSAASAYAKACSDLETAKITADYDRQIQAAGNNSKKKEKLEKERDAKLTAAKNKANKRAMKIEIAQAIASTAMAAINAYASASKEHWLLGPIAAGLATAAGMIQIATIKKQHEAEKAGYYTGGFTGGSRYRREAGVVHEGEFVANHNAVNNPNLLPVLRYIDYAQRNNRVASLTAQDVSRAAGGGAATVVAPQVTVVNDAAEQQQTRRTMEQVDETISRLADRLDEGIGAVVALDGPYGLHNQYQHYLKNKDRI